MRALGLCLLGALCLNAAGCTNPGQPPSLDPFLGRTTVPPPGTGLAAPPSPYVQPSNSNGVMPQSRLPGKRTSQTTVDDAESETASGWRGADAPKSRLVSNDEYDDTQVQTADGEFAANDDSRVEAADYEEEIAEPADNRSARNNPMRKPAVKIRADEEGAEVGVE